MANVIKHKRGSGSDPTASDLVVGEVAIRTDVGKLFTKTDSGTVSEIAGGGSDIVLNTLSSSSGTGGGSATFNGSAYRFTLSQPPSVSAYQLLVSINGIIQKPVTGTSQPSEGFAVDGNDIILGDAPATGSDFFILTFKSLGVSEPADNSVTSAKIVDGAIVNADINASAAIAGSKLNPVGLANVGIGTTSPSTNLDIQGSGSPAIKVTDTTNTTTAQVSANDTKALYGSLTNHAVQIDQNGGAALFIDTSKNVGIGTTSPEGFGGGHKTLEVAGSTTSQGGVFKTATSDSAGTGTNGTEMLMFTDNTKGAINVISADPLTLSTANTERMRIDSSGKVGIGKTPSSMLDIETNSNQNGFNLNCIGTPANYFLNIRDDNVSKFYIDSSGKVGISTTSPAANLHVHTDANGEGILVKSTGNTSNALTFDANRGTGGVIGVAYGRWNGTTIAQMSFVSGDDGTDKNDGYITFGTESAASNGNVNATERMRIDSAGRVGIGTTTGAVGGAPSSQTGQFNVVSSAASGQWAMQARADNAAGNGLFLRAGNSSSYYTAYLTGYNEANVHMVVRGDGKVGIGTASPVNPLHVVLDGTDVATFESTTSGASGSQVSFKHTSSSPADNDTIANLTFDGRDTSNAATTYAQLRVLATNVSNSSESGAFQFFTRNVGSFGERMRIDHSGNVGINEDSPSCELVVKANDSNQSEIQILAGGNGKESNLLFAAPDDADVGAIKYDHNGDHMKFFVGASERMRLNSGGLECPDHGHGSNLNRFKATSDGHIYARGLAGSYISNTASYHQFVNTGNGQWTMQIKQEHHNGMNTQMLVNSTTNIEAFQIYSTSNNTTRFRVLNNGNCANANNSFGSLSDVKLKENIVDANPQWDDVKAVKVRNFNFKNDKDTKLLGVVAQEVETVSSGLVFETIDRDPNDSTKEIGTTKNVKYSILYMKAFKALQEAMAKIEVLETKVAALEAK